jgi:hypothetical protein
MWFFIIKSITGSILGSATSKWFEKTKLGRWTFDKIYSCYNWAADRYGLKIIKAEEKWKEKHPHIAEQMDKMNLRLTNIETYIESEDNNGTKSSKDNES